MITRILAVLFLSTTAIVSAHAAQMLAAETQLEKGQYLSSRSGIFSLVVQNDGNVVTYFNTPMGTRPGTFQTRTNNGDHLRMQMDGNLALYKSDGTWAWTSKTGGRPYDMTYKLVLTETGRVVVLDRLNNVVYPLQEIDKPSPNGGPVVSFPMFRRSGTTCTEGTTPQQFQSGTDAQAWATANAATIGYCNHPYN